MNAGRAETVPMQFDDGNNGRAGGRVKGRVNGRVKGRANNKVFREFGEITFAIPKVNVGASVGERRGRMADRMTDRMTVLLEKGEDAIFDVIAVIHGDTTVDRVRAPKLRTQERSSSGSNRHRGGKSARQLLHLGVDSFRDEFFLS